MKFAIIAFTHRGSKLGKRLKDHFGGSLQVPQRLSEPLGEAAYTSLEDWTRENWNRDCALIFVGACGIAVRAIASHVRDKFSDPAVVVVDEAGHYAIALLSGHVGGANALAVEAAAVTGGQAVITTATDVNGAFAVDVWAKDRQLAIADRILAKRISAAVLEGEPIGFSSDFPVSGTLPNGLTEAPHRMNILVTDRTVECPDTLRLIPKSLVLGIGCRRGKSAEELEKNVTRTLCQAGLDLLAVSCVASIDLKKNEPGLLEFCKKRALPLVTYSAEELHEVQGTFQHSELVERVTGVDNVCERAAALAGGRLVLPKQADNGITVAAARKDVTICL